MLPDILSVDFLMPFVASKIDFSRAIRGLRGMPRRLLLIGHKLDVGTPTITTLEDAPWAEIVPSIAAPGTATLNQIITFGTEAEAVAGLGEGSMLLAMWRAAKANAGLGMPIDIVVVATAAGAASATCNITVNLVGATVGTAGEVMIYIDGHRISTGVVPADTEATIAAKLIAAINAKHALPVVASGDEANADRVVLTCRWPGLTGNEIDVRGTYFPDDLLPAGLVLTIPGMSGGTTSPDIAPVIAAMADGRWTEIALPFRDSTSMATMEAELALRWSASNMRDGQCVTAMRANSSADITAWLNTRNSEQVHTIATKKDMSAPWYTAAAAGAAIESSAVIDPAVPYTDIALVGYKGPKRGEHWTIDEGNLLLQAGASPLQVDGSGAGTLLRVVTNYTLNVVNAPDTSRRELCWIKTMSYKRWFDVTEFQLKYRGFKIAEYITDPIPGQKIMTAELGEEIMIGNYQQLLKVGLVQNMEHYKDSLVVEVDGPNGKLKIQDEPVLVTQHYQTEITTFPIAGHV